MKPIRMTPLQLLNKGLPVPPPEKWSARFWLEDRPDGYLQDVLNDLGKKNLRDLSDPKTRAEAELVKAARFEIRRRKIAALS
jgi:hypothetical protein